MTVPRQRARNVTVLDVRKSDREAYAQAGFRDDLDLDEFLFHWLSDVTPDLDARGAITGIRIERTIDGSSTIEVGLRDPDERLFAGSRMWEPKPPKGKAKRTREYDYYGNLVVRPTERGRAMEVALDGIVFRLIKVAKSEASVTLTFEDRLIYWLRRKQGARRSPRDKVTRAQFILSLLREVKSDRIRFVCPELNVRQPIDSTSSRVVTSRTKSSKGKGSTRGVSGDDLTVKGVRATAEQRRIGSRCLAVADNLGAGAKATLALVEALIVESGIRNIPFGDASSVGVLQLLNLHGSVQRRLDVEWVVGQFLSKGFTGRGGAITLAKRNPGMSAGQIAQACQGSAFPGRYDQVRVEAQKWVDAYGGSGADVPESSAAGGGTKYRSYQFAREPDESSWEAMQRLAGEVGWRCFMMGKSLYYMSEQDLYRRDPLYAITPNDPAILSLDYDVDWGKPVSELTLSVTAGRWKCPPGEPVIVNGYGPPDGRWLCTGWSRDYFSPVAEITLRQPGRETLEPHAEEAATSQGSVTAIGDVDNKVVARAMRRADAIDRKGQAYSWGGGHGAFNDPGGYDCSGFVSSCLHAAGLLDTPQATGGLISWGQGGPGKFMTVWVKENGNPHMSHTFLTFKVKGRTRFAEAGGGESGHTGWHSPRSTAGFEPRHWPGT
jgi:hypothetical protein